MMREWYQVNELFTSLQGEGILAGTPATFIRLQGCPVGCSWCDSGPLADEIKGRMTNGLTRNTWGGGGEKMTVDEIVAKVDRKHVIITGGEPLIWDLDALIDALHLRKCFVQLETSGLRDPIGTLLPDHITISPKENLKFQVPPFLKSMAAETKWVVDATLPYDVVYDYWKEIADTGAMTILMPEGCPPGEVTIKKALGFLDRFASENPANSTDWMFGDRLQYRLGLR